MIARFEGEEVRMYQGAPMTVVSDVATDGPAADGYGARIECPSVHPGLIAAASPWQGGANFADSLLHLNAHAASIVLQRDGGEGGTVSLRSASPANAPFASPVVHYTVRPEDTASMLDAVDRSARIWVAAGCTHVQTLHASVPPLEVPPELRGRSAPGENAPLEAWLRLVREAGLEPNAAGMFSAHQMGTCRMGSDPTASVVDEEGECWELDDLYVCDASVFPTASGVNPMVTTLALAHLISSKLAERLMPHAARDGGASAEAARSRRSHRRQQAREKLRRQARLRAARLMALTAGATAMAAVIATSWCR